MGCEGRTGERVLSGPTSFTQRCAYEDSGRENLDVNPRLGSFSGPENQNVLAAGSIDE